MIVRYILIAIGVYILYRLVFNVIIPVYKTTRQVRSQFKTMKERMEQEVQRQQGFTNTPPPQKTPSKAPRSGDYIDFEEVK